MSTGRFLTRILRIVEDIKSILVLTKQGELDEVKGRLLPEGSAKRRVYELCDGTNTTKTIAQTLGRDEGYVRAYLSALRREGLVRTVDKEGTQVHEQIF